MKHLKRFNESYNSSVTELKKFCNDYLAYLIDAGFEIDVSNTSIGKDYIISIYPNDHHFYFKDIENDFIPFIILLDKKYTLFNNFIGPDSTPVKIKEGANISIKFNDGNPWEHFTVDEIVNNFDINKKILCIYMKVKNEE